MNVIIVDDEAIVRQGIKYSVDWGRLGAGRVEEAANGREVMNRWEEWEPDLIVTDIKMPVLDGIGLIREAKARKSSCRCVVLSCADEFEYVKEALMLGASDYLLKMTVRPEELMACIGRIAKEMEADEETDRTIGRSEADRFKLEAFFRDALSYQHAGGRIRELARLQGLQSPLNRFCVAVMQTGLPWAEADGADERGVPAPASLAAAIDSLASRMREYDCVRLEDREAILVAEALPGEAEEAFADRLDRKLEELAGLLRERLAAETRVGVSRLQEDAGLLPEMYREARRAARRHCLRTDGAVVLRSEAGETERPDEDERILARFGNELRVRLANALAAGNEAAAAQAVDEAFASLRESRPSHRAVRACIDRTLAIVRVAALHLTELNPGLDCGSPETFDGRAFDPYWSAAATAERLKAYFGHLAALRSGVRQEQGCRAVIRDVKRYLNAQFSGRVTLEETARHFHLSKNYLSELFKSETGQTFTRYVNQLRIQKAKELIVHTNDTVSDISDKTGFSDFRYFSRVFRRYTGVSPTEYKARMMGTPGSLQP
ncbi:hypothetical protein J31TS4_04550 [Paenibacillus sp. J31TS4]|uniref:helix-turn-helix domain-containing protein n=1 Tax=Paenibacillus sp. J31TS4 TaxID=2807195 RepID=UPI001B0A8A5C|nr:helix-turn-helix domain-containing protein [Paenibacillus sp. J31TS4]GIP37175.1 hypothetical protein J31TS4_04550 [Paenibacillus sp. J31TS4]